MALLSNNYVLTLLSTVSKLAVRAGTFLIIAPILGPEIQASISVNSAIAAIVTLLFIFGLPVRALREISRDPSTVRAHLHNDFRLMMLLAPPTLLLGVLADYAMVGNRDEFVYYTLLVATLFTALGDYCSAILRSLNFFGKETGVSFYTSLAHLAIVVGIAISHRTADAVAVAILISRAFFAVASLLVVRGAVNSRSRMPRSSQTARETISQAFPYAIDAFLATAISNIDLVVLDHVAERRTVGIYAAGSRLVSMILTLPPIFQNVLIPTLVRSLGTNEFQYARHRVSTAFLVFASVSAIFLIFAGPVFVAKLLGPAYGALNQYWIAFAALCVARVYESYRGILMYVFGWVRVRVNRLAVGLLGMVLLGWAGEDLLGLRGFILALAICSLALGASYPLRKSDGQRKA